MGAPRTPSLDGDVAEVERREALLVHLRDGPHDQGDDHDHPDHEEDQIAALEAAGLDRVEAHVTPPRRAARSRGTGPPTTTRCAGGRWKRTSGPRSRLYRPAARSRVPRGRGSPRSISFLG